MRTRLFALTLALFLAAPCLCAAETVPFTPKAIHAIWDLPWGLAPEEFCQRAQQAQGLVFVKASEYLGQSVYTLDGGPATILGYPAHVKVVFSGEPQVSSLVQFHFLTWDTKTPVSYALNMLGGLYQSICAQYGEPAMAYLMGYNYHWQIIPFVLPIQGQSLEIDRLLPLYQADHALPSCSVQFDNVALVLFPSSDDRARPNAVDGSLEAAFSLWVEACSPEQAKELSVPAKLEPFESYEQLTQQDG
ncbi:MAG: hypothetical protein VB099_04110 [Candidatus Limiplasma sp.]|nr:hypothetical protein [Candidatus Limiplasma sp.]